MSLGGGKEIPTNKDITSRTLKALESVMQNPCDVMVDKGGFIFMLPFQVRFHLISYPVDI